MKPLLPPATYTPIPEIREWPRDRHKDQFSGVDGERVFVLYHCDLAYQQEKLVIRVSDGYSACKRSRAFVGYIGLVFVRSCHIQAIRTIPNVVSDKAVITPRSAAVLLGQDLIILHYDARTLHGHTNSCAARNEAVLNHAGRARARSLDPLLVVNQAEVLYQCLSACE